MTDQIIYAELPGCEEASESAGGRLWCGLRKEYCNLIAVCPLGYLREERND